MPWKCWQDRMFLKSLWRFSSHSLKFAKKLISALTRWNAKIWTQSQQSQLADWLQILNYPVVRVWQWKDSPLSRVHHLPLPYVSWWCTNTPQWHCWIQNGHDNGCVDLSPTNDICPKRKTIYIITCLYAAVTIVSWPHSLSLWIIVGLRSPLRQLSPFSSSSPLHGSFALSLLIPSSSADNTTSVSTLTDWESQQRCLCRRRFFLRVAAASQQLSEETRSFSAALRSAIKPANCCLLSDRHPLRPIVLLEYAVNTAAIYPADWQFLPPRAPKIIITYSTWPVQYILYISRLRDRWAAPCGGHRGRCFYQNSNSVHALNYNHATDKAWNPTEVDFYILHHRPLVPSC